MPLIPQAGPSGGPPVDPAALMALLGGAGGPPPPDPSGGGDQPDPLAALQQVIQDLHALIAVLPNPQDTQVASTCLAQLTKIQSNLMGAQQQAGTAQQAVAQRLGGGSTY